MDDCLKGLHEERRAAIEDAATCAGEFLDELGKTDLATLTPEEWINFIATVCVSYDDAYDAIQDRIAAAKATAENADKQWKQANRVWDKPPANDRRPSWDAPNGGDLDDDIPFYERSECQITYTD